MINPDSHVLLTPAQMGAADRAAMASGISGRRLMAAAGAAVVRAIRARWQPVPTLVLCGPGNNGGDGFIVAQGLQRAGWPVRLALWGPRARLHGDAAWAADQWTGPVEAAAPAALQDAALVVDALLGAGLDRPLDTPMATLVQAVNDHPAAVCAVDLPTGIDGRNGAVLGEAIRADLTVTFFRRKPGHVLLPGRMLCGDQVCADIGIPADVLPAIGPQFRVNHPALWHEGYPWPRLDDHKYRRGHVLMVGGERMLGASRMACLAAARCGAGLVTLAVPPVAWPVQAGALTSVLVEALPADGSLAAAVQDTRRNVLLLGPGLGRTPRTRLQVLTALKTRRPCVLDADALSVFAGESHVLVQSLHARCILTPHAGEFARLFGFEGSRFDCARTVAAQAGVVLVLKGPDTLIAAPDGRCVVNVNAPPTLATAGSGDVLAGMIAGLVAAGMPDFEAACAAVWLHGEAAAHQGPGLLAEDLPAALPAALARLAAFSGQRAGPRAHPDGWAAPVDRTR